MVSFIHASEIATFDFITVASFESPNDQIDAKKAYYLIHEEKPSPMGGFLSAYRTKSDADNGNTHSIGRVLSWDQLLQEYSR
jgi:copper chaperone NosL